MDGYVFDNSRKQRIVYDIIKELGNDCHSVNIAVAYLTDSELLTKWINHGRSINLIVALEYPTNPKILRYLLPKINIKYLPNLHSKEYIFYKNNSPISAIVGSSNFTNGGLLNNVETNILLKDEKYLKELNDHFDEMWARSPNLQPDDIEKYEIHYDKYRNHSRFLENKQRIFRNKVLRNISNKDDVHVCKEARDYHKFWKQVDEICGYVRNISKKEWSDVPIYITIDHFWHFITKVINRRALGKIINNNKQSSDVVQELFKEYALWDKKGEGYTKSPELTAGVFLFQENATGKKYLGVSFLQYNGFLQIPKVCAWEEKK